MAGGVFFLAGSPSGVLVARAIPVPAEDGDRIAKSWSLSTPEQDGAFAEVADLLAGMLPAGLPCRNPLAHDDWRARVTKAASSGEGNVALLFSAPDGVDVSPGDLAEALVGCAQPWIVEVGPGASPLEAFSGRAWLWKAAVMPDRAFASNFEPPEDVRVVDVVSPDGKSRADKITKSARRLRFVRKDDLGEQRLVTGIVLEPEVVDSQGDVYSADEIARAAHGWMEQFQNMGHMHQTLINSGVRPVESYCAPCDLELGGQPVKAGTWLLVVHVISDAVWAQVKAGELTGFSIGGFAQRVPAQQLGA